MKTGKPAPQEKGRAKVPYCPPTLSVYGSVRSMTLMLSNSGIPDGGSGKFMAS